ncbi:hypothetical protein TL16_g02855 [Triparma laevis f. inornata]|uniref:Uncharacterized protein n=1 Tax=Triparma laevis f. inornata TaxID=1714386 RepID=A0A9W6ZYA3_9STRA|nr:hypothetical protein TL16_g02855 [Triparma laevis f. inornata]
MERELNHFRSQAGELSEELFIIKTSAIADQAQQENTARDEIETLKAKLSSQDGELRKLQQERSKHMREKAASRRAEKERCQKAINRSRITSSSQNGRDSGLPLPPAQSQHQQNQQSQNQQNQQNQHQSKRRRTSDVSDLTSPNSTSMNTSPVPPQPMNVTNIDTTRSKPQANNNGNNNGNGNNNSSNGNNSSSNNNSNHNSSSSSQSSSGTAVMCVDAETGTDESLALAGGSESEDVWRVDSEKILYYLKEVGGDDNENANKKNVLAAQSTTSSNVQGGAWSPLKSPLKKSPANKSSAPNNNNNNNNALRPSPSLISILNVLSSPSLPPAFLSSILTGLPTMRSSDVRILLHCIGFNWTQHEVVEDVGEVMANILEKVVTVETVRCCRKLGGGTLLGFIRLLWGAL